MLHETPEKASLKNKVNKRVRFPGIVAAAQALGVNRIHLYLVLSGKRTSRRLTAQYHNLHTT